MKDRCHNFRADRLLTLAIIALLSLPAIAEEPATEPAEPDQPVQATFSFRNAKVQDVLTALGELYDVQFVSPEPIDETITLATTTKTDLDGVLELLDTALAPLGKGLSRQGKVVRVVPRGLIAPKVELIRLNEADPAEVARIITEIFQTRDLLAEASVNNNKLIERLLPEMTDSSGRMLVGQLKVVAIPYAQLKAVIVRAPEVAMPIIKNFIETELDKSLPKPPKPAPPKPKPPAPAPPPEKERIYRLKYVEGDYLAKAAKRLLGIQPIVEPRINALIYRTRKPEEFKSLEDLIAMLDVPDAQAQEIFHVTLNNAVASDVRKVLQDLYRHTLTQPFTEEAVAELTDEQKQQEMAGTAAKLVEAGISEAVAQQFVQGNLAIPVGEVNIVADSGNNALFIRTHPRNKEAILEVIEQLDRVRGQVMINVFIAEIRLDDTIELGMDLTYNSTTDSPGGGQYTTGQDFDVAASTIGLTYNLISSNINAFLRALQATARLDVISRPQILTLDNQAATIEFGQSVPLIQTTQVTESGTVNSTVRYQDVSTRLVVTPHVNAAGFVRMDILQTINTVSSDTFAISENLAPRILITRKAETHVQVRDGQTVCLGGFIGDTIENTESKIPLLSDIPGLGELFKSSKRTRVKSELLIFITPYILSTPRELLAMTNEHRQRSIVLSHPGREMPEMDYQDGVSESPYRTPVTSKTYRVLPRPSEQPQMPQAPVRDAPTTQPQEQADSRPETQPQSQPKTQPANDNTE